jgi:hypothetical protein
MIDIISLLACLRRVLSCTTITQLSRVGFTRLAMAGRVTMRGISRWEGRGGSYHPILLQYRHPLGIGLLAVFFKHISTSATVDI